MTPETMVERTTHLRGLYEDLKKDMLDEVNVVDASLIKPAMDAKDFLQPMKKVIRKRDDVKVGSALATLVMAANEGW